MFRKRRELHQARLFEGMQQKSNWSSIQTQLSRLGTYDLSLLFELKPFLQTFQEPPTIPPVEEFSIVEERFGLPSEYLDGMDGDINYKENVPAVDAESNPSPTNDYPGLWPYFGIEEYPGYGM